MRKNFVNQIILLLISLSVLAAVYSFVIIPAVKKNEEEKYKNFLQEQTSDYLPVLIYKDKTILLPGTLINETMRTKFEILKVPKFCLIDCSTNDFSQIDGMTLRYPVSYGQQIASTMLDSVNPLQNGDERLKEFKIKSLVGETASQGNIVDIIVKYKNGEYDVVVPNIAIYSILNTENIENQNKRSVYYKDEKGYYTVLFAVNEVQYKDLEAAAQLGELETRLYVSSGQTPSDKTFDYKRFSNESASVEWYAFPWQSIYIITKKI